MSTAGGNVKLLQSVNGHKSDVTTCDLAPDLTLITGSSDKTVRLWQWIAGSGYVELDISPLSGHKYQVTCVVVSPQGSMLASASVDGSAILWNLECGTRLYNMVQVNGDAIRVCRFAPDSSVLVTAGDNGAICIWDLVHQSLIRTLFEHEGTTQSLAFTPDSQYLISACSLEVIRVWYLQDLIDTTTMDADCTPMARIDNAHDLGVFCVDVCKRIKIDENDPLIRYYEMATCGNSNSIKIWSLIAKSSLKGKELCNKHGISVEYIDCFDGHTSSVTCVRYNHTGRELVSCSLDKSVKVWDLDGNCLATLTGHTRYVNCLAISRDSSLVVSGSNDRLSLIWDLSGVLSLESHLARPERLIMMMANNRPMLHDEHHPETQLMRRAETDENVVKLAQEIHDVADGAINSCSFDRKGGGGGGPLVAIGSGDKMVRIFNVEDNNNVEEVEWSPLEGHTYAVNHVEFSPSGALLASCSLDGSTTIWDGRNGEKVGSLPENGMGLQVCRFSPDEQALVTAGDDEKAIVWAVDTLRPVAMLEGHLDAVTGACFTPDAKLIVTASTNADFRVWRTDTFECVHVHQDAHEYGIQDCDFSENLAPIPNTADHMQSYLLASCGNDSMVKLWRLNVEQRPNNKASAGNDAEYQGSSLMWQGMEVKLWRPLQGHGGNVISVRFSANVSEIVCSTATDRQARIWSVYSSECLYVLDHDSIVTSCAFSMDCRLLATGTLAKSLYVWQLPQQLVFRTMVSNKIQCRVKALLEWTTSDVAKWLTDMGLEDVVVNARNAKLNGEKIATLTEIQICSGLDLSKDQSQRLSKEIRWLKNDQMFVKLSPHHLDNIPHEYLCPITHEIMREPVICSDGYNYEKNAICEWFMAGKFTSPMTNEMLSSTDYTFNRELRNAIHTFLESD